MNKYLLAQLTNPALPDAIGKGNVETGVTAAGNIVGAIIAGMFVVAFITGFIFLITGGFHWITSGGDKANLENARNRIIHSIVGIIVVAITWAIMGLVGEFTGIKLTEKIKLPSFTNEAKNAKP